MARFNKIILPTKGFLPTTLPYKIRMSDGTVRTDVSSFSDEEVTEVGYTGPYTVPSFTKLAFPESFLEFF